MRNPSSPRFLVVSICLLSCCTGGGSASLGESSKGTTTVQSGAPTTGRTTASTAALWSGAAAVREAMNPAVDPCQDFYEYACGGWIGATEPKVTGRPWSRGFSVVSTSTNAQILTLLESPGESSDPNSKKPASFYASCMDTATIESLGAAPLKDLLGEVSAISDLDGYFATVARVQTIGVPALFLFTVEPDAKSPRNNMAQLYQGGLGLPGSLFYTATDATFVGFRKAYLDYLVKIHRLLGLGEAKARQVAAEIVAFETKLAAISAPISDVGSSAKNYNPVTFAKLSEKSPELPWAAMLAAMKVRQPAAVNLKTPGFFARLGALVTGTKLDVLKDHLRFQVVSANASLLSGPFFDARRELYDVSLGGNPGAPDRRVFCVGQAKSGLVDLLARSYVERYYDRASRPELSTMLVDIGAAFVAGLDRVEWMTAKTRARAREKAVAVTRQLGAPEGGSAVDYSGVVVSRAAFFESSMSVNRYIFSNQMARADEPVNPNDWYAPAYTVNAYYDPTQNDIVVPAGITQPPFFDSAAPAVMGYGALGMILAHEYTHGFDSNGALFTKEGKLEDWWDDESKAGFEARTACLVKQYGAYEALPGVKLDGAATLNENLADNRGLGLAWEAFSAWKAREAKAPVSPVEGLDIDRLFFVAFAQEWCTVDSEGSLRASLRDPHAPVRFRVNGSAANNASFAKAFACAAGTPMSPAERCTVW